MNTLSELREARTILDEVESALHENHRRLTVAIGDHQKTLDAMKNALDREKTEVSAKLYELRRQLKLVETHVIKSA